ncbi:MAG: hypothetical protein ACKO1U_03010 [Bacteroidota bacterium]
MKSRIILALIVAFLATPLWMRIAWEFTPERNLDIVILDKTVLNANSFKHRSINWILDHDKYVKSDGSFYDINTDYFGFLPQANEKYLIADFEKMNASEIDSLASVTDLAYFADTYGILGNEWYRRLDRNDNAGSIYGGLSEKDLLVMERMGAKGKLTIAEFNSIGFPTPTDMRKRFERLLGMEWTGWMIRSIASLDTVANPDLPAWIVRQYRTDHKDAWPFHGPGMLFVHESGKVMVMESGRELADWIPSIITRKKFQVETGVPAELIHPYWMDVWRNSNDSNEVVANFNIPVNAAGMTLLRQEGLSSAFPAIVRRTAGFRFYYFCGDFADNPTKFRFAKLRGITGIKFLLYNAVDRTDRNRFFWEYYLPMMRSILEKEYRSSSMKVD